MNRAQMVCPSPPRRKRLGIPAVNGWASEKKKTFTF